MEKRRKKEDKRKRGTTKKNLRSQLKWKGGERERDGQL
jgi:hypothetical protein